MGNVAWTFICAEKTMHEDTKNKTGGQAFCAADDTPVKNLFEILNPFLVACNIPTKKFKFPMWFVLGIVYIIYISLLILTPVVKLNFPYGFCHFQQMRVSHTFKYEKAKSRLEYRPLYNYKESLQRSIKFYKRFSTAENI